jgi:hypothetical protein
MQAKKKKLRLPRGIMEGTNQTQESRTHALLFHLAGIAAGSMKKTERFVAFP